MKNFLKTYQIYSGKFSEVWLWNDFPYREELGGKDLGIDIIAKTYNGEFWAVYTFAQKRGTTFRARVAYAELIVED